jgi:hypothetical protein
MFSDDSEYGIVCYDMFGNEGAQFSGNLFIDRDTPKFLHLSISPLNITLMPIVVTIEREVIEQGSSEPDPSFCIYNFTNINTNLSFLFWDQNEGYRSGRVSSTARFYNDSGITPAQSNGNWVANVTCYDQASNSVSKNLTFTVNVDAPITVTINSPTPNQILGDNFLLNISTDKVTEYCYWTPQGGEATPMTLVESTDSGDRYEDIIIVDAEGSIPLNVTCRAIDGKTDVAGVEVFIDKTAPNVLLNGIWNTYETNSLTSITEFADTSTVKTLDFNSDSQTFQIKVPAGSRVTSASFEYNIQFNETVFDPVVDIEGRPINTTDSDGVVEFTEELLRLVPSCTPINNYCYHTINMSYTDVARISVSNLLIEFEVMGGLNPDSEVTRNLFFTNPSRNITLTLEVSPHALIENADITFVNRTIAGIEPQNVSFRFMGTSEWIDVVYDTEMTLTNNFTEYIGTNCNVTAGFNGTYCMVNLTFTTDTIGEVYISDLGVDTNRQYFGGVTTESIYRSMSGVDSVLLATTDVAEDTHDIRLNLTINDTYSNITKIEYALYNNITGVTLRKPVSGLFYTTKTLDESDFGVGMTVLNNAQITDISINNIPDGIYLLSVRVFDMYDHMSEINKTIYVDTKDPVITIIYPEQEMFANFKEIKFQIKVQDSFGVESVQMSMEDCANEGGDCSIELQYTDMDEENGTIYDGMNYSMLRNLKPNTDVRKYFINYKVTEPSFGKAETVTYVLGLHFDERSPGAFNLDFPPDGDYFNAETIFNWTEAEDEHLAAYYIYLKNKRVL